MTRKEILDAALKCVNGDRDQQYGKPEDSFGTIAAFWNAYLGLDSPESAVSSRDVAAMLALMKIARISTGAQKDDNWIDLAGYAACGGECESGGSSIETVTSEYTGLDGRLVAEFTEAMKP